ncbi:MAG: RNA polymerase sigma factor [Acidobacteriia bacterium]|nr:RNA polymerase sigma factor [Terriglobia bacterium]
MSQEIMDAGDCGKMDLSAIVESLMLHHRGRWLRFVQRMVENRADAEDVLQEAVLKMLVRDRHFYSPDQARMYLGRIICNTAIELYHTRKRNRRQYRPLHEHLLPAPNCGEPLCLLADQEELQSNARVLTLLHEGLARLPVKQYEALRLTVMDPAIESIRDAGVEHDIPYSTLRHRRLQGLRRLKRFLQRALRAGPARLLMA